MHTNWDPTGEVLPPEDDCPAVQFIESNFAINGYEWICQNNVEACKYTNTLHS